MKPDYEDFFSLGHATQHLAVSVRSISELRAVFALLLLPNRQRLDCRVSGHVHIQSKYTFILSTTGILLLQVNPALTDFRGLNFFFVIGGLLLLPTKEMNQINLRGL